jgi:hypothetical protein
MFAEARIGEHLKFMSRYDKFIPDEEKDEYSYQMFIIGAGWDFYNRNMLLLDFENMIFSDPGKDPLTFLKLTTQINF